MATTERKSFTAYFHGRGPSIQCLGFQAKALCGAWAAQGKAVTLKRLEDFDVHDTRNEEVTGFNIMLALKGQLAEARVGGHPKC